MKAIRFALLTLTLASMTSAQDTILKTLLDKSDVIAHVKVLNVQGGEHEEIGVQEWTAKCEVVELIKGSLKDSKVLSFHFNQFDFEKNEEPSIVTKGKQYVLFLTGNPQDSKTMPFSLVDRWTGALPYHFHLVNRLKEHTKQQK